MRSKKSVVSVLVAMAFILFAISVFAQDSTAVALVTDAANYAAEKWPFMAKVLAVIAVISEVLAVVPSKYISANGVIDTIVKWVQAIAAKIKTQ